jgi:hypothetical protein
MQSIRWNLCIADHSRFISAKNSPTTIPMIASPADDRMPAMIKGTAAVGTISKKISACVAPYAFPIKHRSTHVLDAGPRGHPSIG